MVEYKYWIEINGMTAAKDMTIETALILIKGLYEEYYADDNYYRENEWWSLIIL